MKLRDVVDRIYLDPRKLTEYALNPNHPRGGHKARVFRSALGYNTQNYKSLKLQIESQVLDAEATQGLADKHGQRYVVDIPVQGQSGNEVVVRTCWIVPPGVKEARLTTLIVRK